MSPAGPLPSRTRALALWGLTAVALAACFGNPARALPPDPHETEIIRNTFGEVGILDMPSAHMAPDGQMAVIVGDIGEQQRYNFTFQRKSWFEGTFRYSHVVGLFDGYNDKHFYDRSLGAKFKLINEGRILPDVSVGFRDILGTGVFSSEYLAASKHIGPFDLTAGLGWGELSQNAVFNNPIGTLSKSLDKRSTNHVATGGTPNLGQYFHGPKTGVFGGLIWQTPVDGLSVLAEYSSMTYQGYDYTGAIRFRSPANVGLSYQNGIFGLTAGWFYGSTYGFTATIHGDPTTTYPSALRIGPKVPPPAIRTTSQQQTALSVMQSRNDAASAVRRGGAWVAVPTAATRAKQRLLEALYSEARGVRDVEVDGKSLVIDASLTSDPVRQCATYAQVAATSDDTLTTVALSDLQDPTGKVTFCPLLPPAAKTVAWGSDGIDLPSVERALKRDFAGQQLKFDALSMTSSELWVYYENYKYNSESQAIGRVVRVLMADAPPSVEIFHIIAVEWGVPMQQVTVTRSGFERVLANNGAASDLGPAFALAAAPMTNPGLEQAESRLYPAFSWGLAPRLTQHLFDPSAPLQLMVYADASAALELAPGLVVGGEFTGQLWSNYTFTRPADSQLPHVRTDLLEYLQHGKYGFSNLQIDYRSRLAPDVFADVRAGYLEDMYMGAGAQVLWRPHGSRFAFGADLYQVWKRDFDRLFGAQHYNIVTGHLSIYYRSPWNGTNFALHMGRYLAGDYGATLEVTRRFSTGVEIGSWVTFTNVPFKKFGEGSFDKGIMIHIPFQWGLPIYTQASYDLKLASLTRDGGQRLVGDDALFGETSRTSEGDITDNLDEIVEP